ncbi:class E sortase [Streptomyces sp. NPDC093225]|uniref:class E sortase n=1 Tax=Streptomyces sp. NPDC093225 TaxID=3366034 RepID=UPI00383028AE
MPVVVQGDRRRSGRLRLRRRLTGAFPRVRRPGRGVGFRRRPSVSLGRSLWVGAELAVTGGMVLLLLVVHQVWWTNRQALAGARSRVASLEREWAGDPAPVAGSPVRGGGDAAPSAPSAASAVGGASATPDAPGAGGGSAPPAPSPEVPRGDRAYAVLRIPRLGVVAPVAEGVDKRRVLDEGYVGHYPGTAQPGAPGNFAVAGHRNTHGEPFRYVNRLRAGDTLVVDVRGWRYTYVVGARLDQTLERDTGVIAPVPRSLVRPSYGYRTPGTYITLTTCTPEFTSRYRLVVWGTLRAAERRGG